MYAAGTDITKLRYTDDMQPNPLYNPSGPSVYNPYGPPVYNTGRVSPTPQQNQATKSMAAYAPPAQKQPQGGYSAYAPGKAQSTQTQSQGAPYGQLPPTGSPATSYADAWNAAMPKGGNGVTFTPARSVIGAGAGNMAYAQPGQRPEGFSTQSYDLQGNPVTQGQQAQQRDAFVSQILQAPRDTPQHDFQGMLGKANDMVKGGWQNPFNFNQQQGSVDQLIARLGGGQADVGGERGGEQGYDGGGGKEVGGGGERSPQDRGWGPEDSAFLRGPARPPAGLARLSQPIAPQQPSGTGQDDPFSPAGLARLNAPPGRARLIATPSQGTPYGNSTTLPPEQKSRKNELQMRRVEGARQSPEAKKAESDLAAKRQATEAAGTAQAERQRYEWDYARGWGKQKENPLGRERRGH